MTEVRDEVLYNKVVGSFNDLSTARSLLVEHLINLAIEENISDSNRIAHVIRYIEHGYSDLSACREYLVISED